MEILFITATTKKLAIRTLLLIQWKQKLKNKQTKGETLKWKDNTEITEILIEKNELKRKVFCLFVVDHFNKYENDGSLIIFF